MANTGFRPHDLYLYFEGSTEVGMGGQRRRLVVPFNSLSADDGSVDSPVNATCYLLRPGAQVLSGSYSWTTLNASQTVVLTNPGSLKSGDEVYFWDESGRSLDTDNKLTATSDPTVSGGTWQVALQLQQAPVSGGISSAIEGDRFCLAYDTVADAVVNHYTHDQGGTAATSAVSAGSDGVLERYLDQEHFDLLVVTANYTTVLYPDIPSPSSEAYAKPEDYGAVGDGTTDDTLAVSKAFKEASRQGSFGVLLSRLYLVDQGVLDITAANTVVDGLGWHTGLKMSATAGPCITVSASNVKLRNFKMVGQTTTATGTAAEAVEIAASQTDVLVENVRFDGTSAAASWNMFVHVNSTCTRVTVRGCYGANILGTASGYGVGVYVETGSAALVEGNVFWFSTTQGRHHCFFDSGTSNSKCIDNIFAFGVDDQILVSATQAQNACIDNLIASNLCLSLKGTNGASSNPAAIHIDDNSNNNSILGNKIYGAEKHGIHIESDSATDGSCTDNTVEGNVIVSCTNRGIWVNGANRTKVVGGSVRGCGTVSAGTVSNIYVSDNTTATGTDIALIGVSASGTTNPKYGLEISGTTNLRVIGCNIPEGATGAYTDGGTSTMIVGGDMGSAKAIFNTGIDTLGADIDPNGGTILDHVLSPESIATAATLALAADTRVAEVTGTGTNIDNITIGGGPPSAGTVICLVATNASPPSLVHNATPAAGDILSHTGANVAMTRYKRFWLVAQSIGGTVCWTID